MYWCIFPPKSYARKTKPGCGYGIPMWVSLQSPQHAPSLYYSEQGLLFKNVLTGYKTRYEKFSSEKCVFFFLTHSHSQEPLTLANLLYISWILARDVTESFLIHSPCQEKAQNTCPTDGGLLPFSHRKQNTFKAISFVFQRTRCMDPAYSVVFSPHLSVSVSHQPRTASGWWDRFCTHL